ncbi:MAG: iron-sulfur cluster-binding domain-containing protein [Clostridia bacterium]|nr:iron-sulfur cluster-binding domain-containing protein [Clostridia bacterium]
MSNRIIVRSPVKDVRNFTNIPEMRKGVIKEAPETPLNANNAVNSIANFLHPPTQFLKVKQVAEISKDTRAYILEPDTAHGTAKLAYFRPGQSISVILEIGSAIVTRAFTICSSPTRSLDDEYVIIVKKKPDGFASDFILNTWRKGTQISASAPFGEFYYQALRDSKKIIGISDNYGISPFLSMAEAIADGSLNLDLTLIFAARKQNEAIMSERLNELAEKSAHFKVVYVFSDEHVFKCERGFVTKSLIEKYATSSKFSIFVSGTQTLYNRVVPQIAELKLENKYIRFAANGKIENPASLPDFPKDAIDKTFLCKVVHNGKNIATVPCKATETLLTSLERDGVKVPSHCSSGECGFCRSKVIKGNVFIPDGVDSRRLADSSYGVIHPCCSYPMSDLTIVIS